MKSDRTHDTEPTIPSTDTTDSGASPPAHAESASDRALSPGVDRPDVIVTSPDAVDVERLLRSLDREPRPPAPIPDERASSNGGRFVAYRGTGRPVIPQTEQEARFQALSELSVLVNATPVPADISRRDLSTAPLGRGVVNARVIWMGAAILTAAGGFALLVALSRSHAPQLPPAAAPEPIAPVVHAPVLAAPSPVAPVTTRPEAHATATEPPTPAARPTTRTVHRHPAVAPSAALSTEEPRPRTPAFENW
jgi:hypothetical protein